MLELFYRTFSFREILLKWKCVKCNKWADRKDMYKTSDSWLRPHYVCKKCMFDPKNYAKTKVRH